MASSVRSQQRAKFVREFLIDLNATQAAIRAGYSPRTAKMQGSRLLTRDDVQAEIERHRARAEEKLDISVERIERELAMLAFVQVRGAFAADGTLLPLKNLPEDVSRSLSSVETDEIMIEGVPVGKTRKIKAHDKLRALELLGKRHGAFTDNLINNVVIGDDQALAERVRILIEKAKARAGKSSIPGATP